MNIASPQIKQLVVYCRASSLEDVAGIEEQKSAAQKYAYFHGLEVARVFEDVEIAGDTLERPALIEMLHYLDANKPGQMVVVVHGADVLGERGDILEILTYTLNASGAQLDTAMPEVLQFFKPELLQAQLAATFH